MSKDTKGKKGKKSKKNRAAATPVEEVVIIEAPSLEKAVRQVKANGRLTLRQILRKVESGQQLTASERAQVQRVERAKVKVMKEHRQMEGLLDRAELMRKQRNETIRLLCDLGLSESATGELVGISGPRVNQIYFGKNGSKA
jgi:hypothetical protein